MYTAFRVQNFRCFEDLELTDLGRVNLIVGKNNTGKTTLLQAIYLSAGYYTEALFDLLNAIQANGQTSASGIDSLFYNFDVKKPILFLLSKITENVSNFQATGIFAGRDVDSDSLYIRSQYYDIKDGKNFNYESSNLLNRYAEYTLYQDKQFYIKSESRDKPPKELMLFLKSHKIEPIQKDSERFVALRMDKQTQILVNVLDIIEPRLVNIELVNSKFYADISGVPKLIPLDAMGAAINRINSVVLALSAAQDGIVLIDEIENGLHYAIMPDIWRAIAKAAQDFNVQIFATTHSLEMIRAAHDVFKERDDYDFRLHRLSRDDTGKIIPVKFNEYIMDAVMAQEYEVRG